ncbi:MULTISPECIES: chemotaxis signal transducer protein Htr18 [Halobacterium]|uniref:chemotaxis signal transducer protein Htr18 n=1 Tax=Halobacterium TaxID=2239 RepID=UPI001962A28D|nr:MULTISPECIES: chemotaxis signal transducer protein Htr18 [Halobacterium]MCF2206938.1 HAMP domain-containing protein [Halobacterium salinarum]MDL0121603.1 chemotaxis signal transducer protein Htr18 [Halobacterium salinarum]MDL0126706.1 chemotaxis signal transducer protein Htr18 [Halobacterium salinarum]QRY25408.1 chemotaxis signal transducer protein Htr18 [Halobacterium sp. BOL4-2]
MALGTYVPTAIRTSLLRKAAVVIVTIMLVLVGVGVFTTQAVSTQVTEQRDTELLTSTEQEAEALEEWIGRQRSATQYLSQDNAIQSAPQADKSEVLSTRISGLTETAAALHYVNLSTDTIRASTDAAVEGDTYTSYSIPWRGEGLSFYGGGDVITSSVFNYRGTPVMAFASKQPGSDNAVFVFHSVETRGEAFSRNIDGSYTQVVDIKGTVQIAADESAISSAYGAGRDAPVIATGLTTNSGIETRDGLLVGHAKVEGTDWVLLKHAPTSNAYALEGDVQRNIVVLIVTAVAGLGALVLVIGRDALTALTDMSDRAEAIAAGDIDTAIEETTRIDEVGDLKRSFRDIQEYLQTVAGQADALAEQDFDADALDKSVPGRLGESLETMHWDLETAIADLEDAQETAEQSRKEAEQSREEAEALAAALESQAQDIRETVEHAADGDLTQRLETDTDHESMAAIATALNSLLEELEGTIHRIQRFSKDVAESSDHITTSAEEVKRASGQVSESVQEMSADARQQNGIVQDVSDEMTDLSATIEEIASSSDEVAAKSNDAVSVGQSGRARSQDAIEEMNAVDEQAKRTIAEMEALDDEMTEIGEIVTLIDDIAEQTSMLALNASIEAARAGEAGEGFAVVADEIKSLSKETTEATQEIESLIADVQDSTTDAVTDMQEMGDRLSEGKSTVTDTVETIDTIVERIEEANGGVQTINTATDEQATTTEEVVTMVDEVGSISDDTTARAEDAAAAAEEQTASLTEVTNRIQDLSDQSTDLYELLSDFTVREDHAVADGGAENTTGAFVRSASTDHSRDATHHDT